VEEAELLLADKATQHRVNNERISARHGKKEEEKIMVLNRDRDCVIVEDLTRRNIYIF
jgi:hypothetical protein